MVWVVSFVRGLSFLGLVGRVGLGSWRVCIAWVKKGEGLQSVYIPSIENVDCV